MRRALASSCQLTSELVSDFRQFHLTDISHSISTGPLAAGKQALHWKKISHRLLSALGLHMPAHLLATACQDTQTCTTLRRAVTLAADNSCPALAAGLSIQMAAGNLQSRQEGMLAAAIAALEESGLCDSRAVQGGRKAPKLVRSTTVSVDTSSSWAALEDPADHGASEATDDTSQLSRLCLAHWRSMCELLAGGSDALGCDAAELQQWSDMLASAQQTLLRRARLQTLMGVSDTLQASSLFDHYAAKSLLNSSSLSIPGVFVAVHKAKPAAQARPARGRKAKQSAVKTVTGSDALCRWIQGVVQLCGMWGNADVFGFLRTLARVCAQSFLASSLGTTHDDHTELMLSCPDEALMQRSSSDEMAQAALMLFSGALAVLPVTPAACVSVCEELAVFATACGMAATPFVAMHVVNRLASANAVQWGLLCGAEAGDRAGGYEHLQSAEADIVLRAVCACSKASANEGSIAHASVDSTMVSCQASVVLHDASHSSLGSAYVHAGCQSYEAGMRKAVRQFWSREADMVCMVHVESAMNQRKCLLVASLTCAGRQACSTAVNDWTIRVALQEFPNEDGHTSCSYHQSTGNRCSRHGSDSDSAEFISATCTPAKSVQTGLQAVRHILDESASGCKRWTAASAASRADQVGVHSHVYQKDSSQSTGGAQVTDARHEWWSWRTKLDDRLHAAVQSVGIMCKAPLHHCLPHHEELGPSRQKPCNNACSSLGQGARPLELLLSWDLHCFPWEAIKPFAARAVFRSLPGAHMNCKDTAADVRGPRSVDVRQALYVVDPTGDLPGTRKRFEPWFRSISGWHGTCGVPAIEQQKLHEHMRGQQFFVYLGHGAGVCSSHVIQSHFHASPLSYTQRSAPTSVWLCLTRP